MPISQYDIKNIGRIIAGEGDWFTAKLLRLMAKADTENQVLLAEAFPVEFIHFCNWQYGGVPTRFSKIRKITTYVNHSEDTYWVAEGGRKVKLVIINNGRDY